MGWFGRSGKGDKEEDSGELTAGNDEDGVAEPHNREVPQVLEVDGVATDAEEGKP